jgi:ADP-ribosylglycohydrolase
VDACRYFAGLVVGALRGATKEELLSARYCPAPGVFEREPLSTEVESVARGSFKEKRPPAIRGTGYVVDCLEAALWAFWTGADFRSGLLLAVNLGDDADTTGAVFGQIAGAHYGEGGIPEEWQERLANHDLIAALAERRRT